MQNNKKFTTTKIIVTIKWVLVTFIALMPWLVLSGSENLPIYLSGHNLAYTTGILLIIIIIALIAMLIDKLIAAKTLLVASCLGFIFELVRTIFLYLLNADFSDYCIGLFIHLYGLSCCDAISGCSDETFLLTFFVVLLVGTLRLVKSKHYGGD